MFEGGGGDDWLYGQRGSDTILAHAGNDFLSGGAGDDHLYGENGWDVIGGGFGNDNIDGGQDSDMIRADATTDKIHDTGTSGVDTLNYGTAATPGFVGGSPMTGFPGEGGERGVTIRLDGVPCSGSGEYEACNGEASVGGGYDHIDYTQFENIIGSPFSDLIIGNNWTNRIDGGGGADVIYGADGNDVIVGGADGDYIDGGNGADTSFGLTGNDNCIAESKAECEGTAAEVHTRDTTKIEVGWEQNTVDAWSRSAQLYLVGSIYHDSIKAIKWFDNPTQKTYISFELFPDSTGQFDTSASAQTPNCIYWPNVVHCALETPIVDSVTIAGMGADDNININEAELGVVTTPVILGGDGNDVIWGSWTTEDIVIDGPGNDWMFTSNWDDTLLNSSGADTIQGGADNDLIVSGEVCGGDYLNGSQVGWADGAQNTASWAKLAGGQATVVNLENNVAGNLYSGGVTCTFGSLSTLAGISDLEGSEQNDVLYGSNAKNDILGRDGIDTMAGFGANDDLWGRNNVTKEPDGIDNMDGNSGENRCFVGGKDTTNNCTEYK